MSRKNNHTKAERIIGREYKIPSSPLFTHHLVAISASHRKGRPCLAGAPGSGSSSPHCSRNNDHCALQCSAASPSPLLDGLQWPRTSASHPSRPTQRSTEHSHIPALSACQEALGTERKRDRTESWSHWRLPNGVSLRSTPVFLVPFVSLHTMIKLLIAVVVYPLLNITACIFIV